MKQTIVYCDWCGDVGTITKEIVIDEIAYDFCTTCRGKLMDALIGKGTPVKQPDNQWGTYVGKLGLGQQLQPQPYTIGIPAIDTTPTPNFQGGSWPLNGDWTNAHGGYVTGHVTAKGSSVCHGPSGGAGLIK